MSTPFVGVEWPVRLKESNSPTMKARSSQSRYTDDRYTAQRRVGFPWLLFVPDLEEEYRQRYIPMNASRLRVAHTTGILAVLGFIVMDEMAGGRLQPLSAILVLLLVTIPSLAAPIAATWSKQAGAHIQRYIFVCGFIMGLSLVAVVWLGRAANTWFPYESLLLVTMYVYSVSGLLFFQAAFVGFSIWLGFLACELAQGQNYPVLYETYYLFLANVIGLLGLYMQQYDARLGYLMQNELRQQAVQDALTGVLNRRAFRNHLDLIWAQAQRERVALGLLLVDLDGFKKINDNCGHPFGDTALQHVGQALSDCARRPLDAVGRYGGDEFIAVWYGVDANWFARVAHEFPRRLDDLQCGDPAAPVKVTVSGGAVLVHPQPGIIPQAAVNKADEKLYEMKRNQRGAIGYEILESAPPA